MRRASDIGIVEFLVKRQKIADALHRLKDNNPFCSDIEIDFPVQNFLPENRNIEQKIDRTEITNTSSNNFENDIMLIRSFPLSLIENGKW